MLTNVRFLPQKRTLYTLCVIGLLSQALFGAQQPKDGALPAPVPASIAAAKKVFIANAPGDSLSASLGGPARPYNEFYAAMKSWGRYELVSTPADADLILEISFASPFFGINAKSPLLLKLVIVDPKVHTPLWWFTESFELKGGFSHRKETLSGNFDHSIADLVDDVRKLVGAPAVVTNEQQDSSSDQILSLIFRYSGRQNEPESVFPMLRSGIDAAGNCVFPIILERV